MYEDFDQVHNIALIFHFIILAKLETRKYKGNVTCSLGNTLQGSNLSISIRSNSFVRLWIKGTDHIDQKRELTVKINKNKCK